MSQKTAALVFTLFCIHIFQPSTGQCLMFPLPLQQRVSASGLIAEGKVISQFSFICPKDNEIYTAYKVEVSALFKGSVSNNFYVISKGGVYNDRMLKVYPTLQLKVGEEGILMCQNSVIQLSAEAKKQINGDYYEAYGLQQGFIQYTHDFAFDPFNKYVSPKQAFDAIANLCGTKPQMFSALLSASASQTKSLQAPTITSLSPLTISAGTLSVLTINGSGFGSTRGSGTVGFYFMDDNGGYIDALSGQYQSWSDNEIQVIVPAGSGSGAVQVTQGGTTTSTDLLDIPFNMETYDDSASGLEFPLWLYNENNSGGYTFYMNDSMALNSPAESTFLRAFDTWRCITKVNWIFDGTSPATAASQGLNLVHFDNTNPLAAGVLGQCGYDYNICGNGSGTQTYLTYADISIHSTTVWNYGPQAPASLEYDLETIFLHELGHAHILNHTISTQDFMHWSLPAGVEIRTLTTGDTDAGVYEMSGSIIRTPCGEASVADYTGTCPVTSIPVVEQTSLKIYPNPASDEATIEGTNANGVISIYNESGSLVQEIKSQEGLSQILIGGLEPGIYFVQYRNGETSAMLRFAKL